VPFRGLTGDASALSDIFPAMATVATADEWLDSSADEGRSATAVIAPWKAADEVERQRGTLRTRLSSTETSRMVNVAPAEARICSQT